MKNCEKSLKNSQKCDKSKRKVHMKPKSVKGGKIPYNSQQRAKINFCSAEKGECHTREPKIRTVN